ncbi:MAG TPA: phospholipase D-like domain-containing protein [Gemmataceae bacterium]|jgi:phosphatidylserine/phosphatidylglycerophosphate/cardiolipin synthase-like enzyme|nr:phospholipase D-like domain-containing protein [Gemmataceae bacterium]
MSIDLKVYDNGDHTTLVWLPDGGKAIPDCRGFAIRRLANGKESFLHGFVGFSDDDKLDPQNPWKFPLQRYMWWDYTVSPGDVVQYAIVPVIGPDHNHLKLATAAASALTPAMTVTGQATPHVAAYFNKGIVAAQWVSRALAAAGKDAKLANLIATPGNKLRNELSGLLRPQLLDLLADVKKNDGQVYLALYELNDPELLDAITAIGKKCHLLLANGAFKPPTNDENSAVRAKLRDVVDLHDRLVTSGHFAHNKYAVACDANGNPLRVLSGSTNWTMTGLCTQANNGVIVNSPELGADFINEWNLLKNAGNAYPPTLAQANSTSKSFAIDGGRLTQWFAPTSDGQDLEFARTLINGAKDGIMFLFFNPGGFAGPDKPPMQWTLLQNILVRHQPNSPVYDPSLYMRGVVNQEIAGLTSPLPADTPGSPKHMALDPTVADNPVTLFSGGNKPPQRLTHESMVPSNIKEKFHDWETEMLGTGVHIHSKVIVIDPFGDHPVVMTGSHNLGYKASSKNDDNLMIVEGNAPLAAAFAANIIAIYQTYRWNAYVQAHRNDPKVWHGLVDTDAWQNSYLTGDELAEIEFWLGQHAAAPATGGAIKSVTAPHVAAKVKKKSPAHKQPTKKKVTKKTPKTKAAKKKSSKKKTARK